MSQVGHDTPQVAFPATAHHPSQQSEPIGHATPQIATGTPAHITVSAVANIGAAYWCGR